MKRYNSPTRPRQLLKLSLLCSIMEQGGIIVSRKYKSLTIADYEITTNGDVINKHSGRIVKGQPNGKGYLRVSIGHQLKFIHRLVAEKYLPNPENKPQVNHKDGDKTNNHVNNLEWVTNSENRAHAVQKKLHLSGSDCTWAKLTDNDVKYVRKHPEISCADLAKKFNVSWSTINDIRKGRTWKNS